MASFGHSQRSYYLSEINRGIPVSAASTSLDTPTIRAAALETANPFLNQQIDPNGLRTNFNFPTFTNKFTTGSNVTQKDSVCRTSPLSIGMRDPAARTGCGWWFSNSGTSTGAYGSRRGPMDPGLDAVYGSGEWIWDLNDAIKREGQKNASRVMTCADLTARQSTFPNLGWCPSTNRAIVTDGNGRSAYPNTPQGACQGTIITNANQCSSISGVPGAPGSPGAPGAPGAPGGSGGTATANSCIDGNLSPGCLKTIVQSQCNSTGTLAQALNSGYASTNQNAMDMNTILLERNFTLPSGILNDGRITQSEAINSVKNLRSWTNDSNLRTAGAAKNLCFGTPFDMCDFSATTRKPFSPVCIFRMAQAAGWSPNGIAMPANDGDMNYWNNLNTWGDVLGQISSWKQLADNPGPNQLSYIAKVYGMSAAYPNRCPSVTVSTHCAPNVGDQKILPGAGTYFSSIDFFPDASYIVVPEGATADLFNAGGDLQRVVGPGEFNFCSRGGFNDNVRKIMVYPTI